MLKLLIDYNCNYNINILSSYLSPQESVLTYALRYSNTDIIDYLKSKNAVYYRCY